MSIMATDCYIALGSNRGDREFYLNQALRCLDQHKHIQLVRQSPFYETQPVGMPLDASPFLNGVIHIKTTLPAREILHELLSIEEKLGRLRSTKGAHESRTLDLDLLFYGDEAIHEDDLHIPHPRLHLRRFVLEPLADLCPGKIIPERNETVAQALHRVQSQAAI